MNIEILAGFNLIPNLSNFLMEPPINRFRFFFNFIFRCFQLYHHIYVIFYKKKKQKFLLWKLFNLILNQTSIFKLFLIKTLIASI